MLSQSTTLALCVRAALGQEECITGDDFEGLVRNGHLAASVPVLPAGAVACVGLSVPLDMLSALRLGSGSEPLPRALLRLLSGMLLGDDAPEH